jgi:transcriptional regulator with XRE-family HTH domain
VESLEDRVRSRIVALYERGSKTGEKWTAEKLAKFIGADTPSAVRKILTGLNHISLRHIEGFSTAFQVTPAELMIEPGAVIQPISPLESTILAHVRQMTELERRSLLTLLDRHLTITSPRQARLGRAMLSAREQELVDLFARSDDGAREGVLKVLRGSAAARQAHQKTS